MIHYENGLKTEMLCICLVSLQQAWTHKEKKQQQHENGDSGGVRSRTIKLQSQSVTGQISFFVVSFVLYP